MPATKMHLTVASLLIIFSENISFALMLPRVRNLAPFTTPTTTRLRNDNFTYEIFDYANSPYSVDQGTDEFPLSSVTDEVAIEEMREDRRRRNDEFQFETFSAATKKTFYGLWSEIPIPSDSIPGATPSPSPSPLRVVSRVTRDGDVLSSSEMVIVDPDLDGVPAPIESRTFPPSLRQLDFRGDQGNMIVANAYTVCRSDTNSAVGPHKKLNIEIAITYSELRLRLKVNYEAEEGASALNLQKCYVVREREGRWPSGRERAFFGPSGAPGGGLFDPPVIAEGTEDSYLEVELGGYATALFPGVIDQEGALAEGDDERKGEMMLASVLH